MADHYIKAIDENKHFIINAAITTNTIKKAQKLHKSSPYVTSALGRLMTGSILLAAQLKENEKLMLQITCSGSVEGLLSESTNNGYVRAMAINPYAIPEKDENKNKISSIIGKGKLSVIKTLKNQKAPYQGIVRLQTGEIAKDITFYLTVSEQIPSVVALSTSIDKDNSVINSGGFIIQALPGATTEEISTIEKNINYLPPVSHLLDEGMNAEELIKTAMKGINTKILQTVLIKYKCTCSRKKVEKVLLLLGKQEIKSLIYEQKPHIIRCGFCGKNYIYSNDDLQMLEKNLKLKDK